MHKNLFQDAKIRKQHQTTLHLKELCAFSFRTFSRDKQKKDVNCIGGKNARIKTRTTNYVHDNEQWFC